MDLPCDQPPTCKDCRHFHKAPPDASTIGQPKQGECRGGPPVMFVAGAQQTVQGIVPNVQVMYPRVNETFPICGVFQPREVWQE